jgi:DNA helicase II / ATP-dependent DNA helicase PcrA
LNLSHLNSQQLQAVTSNSQHILVVAGPGSGKTRVLTHRIAHLIEQGILPERIVGLTFTNKAGAEIKERTRSLTKTSIDGIFLGTFHSFGVNFLRREVENLNIGITRNFTILDTGDLERLAKRILDILALDRNLFKRLLRLWDKGKTSGLSYEEIFLDFKNRDLDSEKCIKFFELLKKETIKSNSLDFNDLLLLTLKGLQHPSIGDKWRSGVDYLLVDEWQDTNFLQYEIVRELTKDEINNFFAVGDPDQAIYGWRGADPQNLFKLRKDFKGLEIIELSENYRSTGKILRLANKILKFSVFENRKLESKAPGIHDVKFYEFLNPEMESEFVVKKCGDMVRQGQVQNFSDIAILFRTNFQTRILEEAFIRQNIPYKIVKGLRFFERAEVKDVLAYLRFLCNEADNLSFERMVANPPKGVGEKSLSFFLEFGSGSYHEAVKDFDNFIHRSKNTIEKFLTDIFYPLKTAKDKQPLSRLVEKVIELTGYYQYIDKIAKSKEESLARKGNLEELVRLAARFEEREEPLMEFLESIGLNDEKEKEEDEKQNAVQLMTLHTSKGLEFDSVFIISVNEEIIPHKNSIEEDRIDEERRLFFVGVTRAKKLLNVSFVGRNFQGFIAPSRFLKEVDALEEVTNSSFYGDRLLKKRVSEGVPPSSLAEQIENQKFEGTDVTRFEIGDIVKHNRFGRGKITSFMRGGVVKVQFAEGEKVLSLALARLEKI